MASNKDNMIKKHGSEAAYKEYMRSLAKNSSRGKDTIESLTRRIKVLAKDEGVRVEVKVRKI